MLSELELKHREFISEVERVKARCQGHIKRIDVILQKYNDDKQLRASMEYKKRQHLDQANRLLLSGIITKIRRAQAAGDGAKLRGVSVGFIPKCPECELYTSILLKLGFEEEQQTDAKKTYIKHFD